MARFRQVIDCATGVSTRVPFTAQEETARDAEEAAAALADQQDSAARTALATAFGNIATDINDRAKLRPVVQGLTTYAKLATPTTDQTATALQALIKLQFALLQPRLV